MSNDEIVGSKIPAKNGYGQNGYQGPSSVPMSNQPSTSASLKPKNSDPVADVKAANVATFNEAERKHDGRNVAAGYGMKDRTESALLVPSKTDRRKD